MGLSFSSLLRGPVAAPVPRPGLPVPLAPSPAAGGLRAAPAHRGGGAGRALRRRRSEGRGAQGAKEFFFLSFLFLRAEVGEGLFGLGELTRGVTWS